MTDERVQRRLAAVMCTDVAGYSRLMGADEEGTLAALKRHRHELVDSSLATHRGRIVKTTGDGALVEFASVVDAVRCAVDIQRGMAERNATIPADKQIRFRIGINLGDIMIDEGDIFGDGVNVAARLEALAEPGGICISRAVREQVGDKADFTYTDLGEHNVKNIARPVHVYQVDLPGQSTQAVASAERSALPLPDRPSIVVLPFANMSGDADQDYFADGMVEDIITGLARIKWLFVIARNTSFVYKGRAVDVKLVGRELGVRYVLEGSVRRAGNRVRITAQLIEAATAAHLWAERYDRALDDVFALQDEITLAVIGAIEPSLRAAEVERVKRKRPENLDAYDLVLRAAPLAYAAMPEQADEALLLLQRALALEPDYAMAHAMAGWCHEQRFFRGGLAAGEREAGLRHAQAALAAGAEDANVLGLAGFVIALLGHDLVTAREAFERALALSPSNVIALGFGAVAHVWAGDGERAIEWAERALRLSPFDPLRYTPLNALAIAHFHGGRFDAAADASRRAIQVNPRFSLLHVMLAASLVRLGRTAEAKAAAGRVLALEPGFSTQAYLQTVAPGDGAAAIAAACREAGLPG
jgi:TolB-like protein/class 3 adenylate cyclase